MVTEQLTSVARIPGAHRLARIQAEYLEMPGLHLTSRQAQRLWSIEPQICELLLGSLVGTGFLRLTRTGAYVRVDGAR
jgi:hypothetical protein